MLGGAPVPAQFLNSRPRVRVETAASERESNELLDDEWDEALYRAVVMRFNADIARAKR